MAVKYIIRVTTDYPDGMRSEGYVLSPTKTHVSLTGQIKDAHHFPSKPEAREYVSFIRSRRPRKVKEIYEVIGFEP